MSHSQTIRPDRRSATPGDTAASALVHVERAPAALAGRCAAVFVPIRMDNDTWRRAHGQIEVACLGWSPDAQGWGVPLGGIRGAIFILLRAGVAVELGPNATSALAEAYAAAHAQIAAAHDLIARVGPDIARDRYGVTPGQGDALRHLARLAA